MKQRAPELFQYEREGFFWCEHCNHVIELPPEAEVNQTYKCQRCHHWTVRWKFPAKPRAVPRPRPAAPEVAAAGFRAIYAALEGSE